MYSNNIVQEELVKIYLEMKNKEKEKETIEIEAESEKDTEVDTDNDEKPPKDSKKKADPAVEPDEDEEDEVVESKTGDKEEYQKFFASALKKFGVDSPSELSGKKEKDFYAYIDKNWESDDEAKLESFKTFLQLLK